MQTTEKLGGPEITQFSVFLNNKVGALRDLVRLLREHSILVLALTVLDASESAIGRILVSDPERTRDLFRENNIPFSETSVLAVELAEGAADLPRVLSALLLAEVNIHFCYPLLTRPRGRAVFVVCVDDIECARGVLNSEKFQLLKQTDLSR
ncbi:MAG: hypothetical protein N2035_07755 [Chthoniobacterales bacterium]|nr:hypothetical protein [Chthoniobacterales bacterium]